MLTRLRSLWRTKGIPQDRARKAHARAKRRAFWQRVYSLIDALFHINLRDFAAFLRMFVKWVLLGGLVGVLAGTASAVFLITLAWATNTRLENPALVFLLPIAGLVVGWVYFRFAGSAAQGNNLVIEEVNANKAQIPFRMAPLVLFGTITTHLFGGSAGREGTAIQMGASLADSLRRVLRLSPDDRRLIIMAGISGGFGSVFGTPVAGFVFGMEVQSVGRIRYDGIIPCLAAAYIGDIVTRLWGAAHTHYPHLANLEIDPLLLIKVAEAAVIFGLTSILFVELTHGIKKLQSTFVAYPPMRSFIGGVVIIGLALLLGTNDYLGLSLPLIQQSVNGEGVATFAFLLKLIFTTITLGSGFLGGEVTPLFAIGATLGFTLGGILGVDPAFMAALGFVAVFAGASNTPLACALMGIELFGGGSALYLILACVIAYLASGHRGIYMTQLVGAPKFFGADIQHDESLRALTERRSEGWLPERLGMPAEFLQRSVRSIMSRHPVTVKEETALLEMIDLALREGLRSIPVLNAQNIISGIITDDDLKRAGIKLNITHLMHLNSAERRAALEYIGALTAQHVMSHPAITISPSAVLQEAIDMLDAYRFKRLPVVDESGHLLGMITRCDILREIASSGEQTIPNPDARVDEVDQERVIPVMEDASISAVIQLMREHAQKRLVVVDDVNRVIGILTERDILERVSNGDRSKVLILLSGQTLEGTQHLPQTASELMTAPVITVREVDSALVALKLLMDNGIKRLPVVAATGQPIGLIGRAGLIRVLMRSAT